MKELTHFIKTQNLTTKSEIVFFGGSFHPWHEGHSECIRLLPKDKTLIVVPDHSPHKKVTNSTEKASDLTDIKNELSKINKQVYLFDGFWLMNKVNPTVVWVEEIKKEYQQIDFSLLIGFDSFKNITTWNHPEILLNSLSSLYVVSRLESVEERDLFTEKVKAFNNKLKIEFLGHHPYEHISSTEIRNSK